MRKGGRGVLDTKSLCAKGGGGSGYEKFVRKGGRGVLDRKSSRVKGGGRGFWIRQACAQTLP